MKKIICFLLFAVAVTGAFAQKDATAKAILDPISKKYRSYNLVKSDFTFTLDNTHDKIKASQNGTLTVEPQSQKFRITLYVQGSTKPEIEQEIINDGKSQWTYNKADKEVQLRAADHSATSFNPAHLFT